MKYGCQSDVGKIEHLLLKHPKEAFISQDNLNTHWKEFNYLGCPNYEKALKEYDGFLELLVNQIPEINFLPRDDKTGLDSIYVRDPVIMTNKGAILCNMGKKQRRQEPSAMSDFLPDLNVPILGSISGEARLEGGDAVWIDERTLAVGRGYRTNDEGIQQLKQLLTGLVDEMIEVHLPHWQGPNDVMHLMSLLSFIDHKLALVYSRLLPVSFREWLLARNIRLMEVPDSEFESMACNVLAVAPRKCIVLSGNPLTKKMLENEGVEVWEYIGEEISMKGSGGPTCLTLPIYGE